MGKRKSYAGKTNKTGAVGYSPFHVNQNTSKTLREESIGKKQQQRKTVNAKSMLKSDHIKKLIDWTNDESSISSLSAFFGKRLSRTVEFSSVPADPNLFYCQRCESILQPGFNCTVRIDNKNSKHSKSNQATQNSVIYSCHFCSHRNLKRGTPKNYMKDMRMPKSKSGSKLVSMVNVEKLPKTEIGDEPSTPIMLTKQAINNGTLLELRTKKRNRSGLRKTVTESSSIIDGIEKSSKISLSNKRKRKSWTSLKQIAELNKAQDDTHSFANLRIPFFHLINDVEAR